MSQDFDLCVSLGADVVLDYTDPEYLQTLKKLANFDVIFDFARLENGSVVKLMEMLRPWSNSKLVTLTSPLIHSTDQNGLVPGAIETLTGLATQNIQTIIQNGTTFRYGYFMPNPGALNSIRKLVEKEKVRISSFSCTKIILGKNELFFR